MASSSESHRSPAGQIWLRRLTASAIGHVHEASPVAEEGADVVETARRLFLGGAETMIGIDDGWERLAAAGSSYYRPMR